EFGSSAAGALAIVPPFHRTTGPRRRSLADACVANLRPVTAVTVKMPMNLRSSQCDGAFGCPHTGPPPTKRISIETVIRQPEEILLPNFSAAHDEWNLAQVCSNTRSQFL